MEKIVIQRWYVFVDGRLLRGLTRTDSGHPTDGRRVFRGFTVVEAGLELAREELKRRSSTAGME
jgi:hypothetical protein